MICGIITYSRCKRLINRMRSNNSTGSPRKTIKQPNQIAKPQHDHHHHCSRHGGHHHSPPRSQATPTPESESPGMRERGAGVPRQAEKALRPLAFLFRRGTA